MAGFDSGKSVEVGEKRTKWPPGTLARLSIHWQTGNTGGGAVNQISLYLRGTFLKWFNRKCDPKKDNWTI